MLYTRWMLLRGSCPLSGPGDYLRSLLLLGEARPKLINDASDTKPRGSPGRCPADGLEVSRRCRESAGRAGRQPGVCGAAGRWGCLRAMLRARAPPGMRTLPQRPPRSPIAPRPGAVAGRICFLPLLLLTGTRVGWQRDGDSPSHASCWSPAVPYSKILLSPCLILCHPEPQVCLCPARSRTHFLLPRGLLGTRSVFAS